MKITKKKTILLILMALLITWFVVNSPGRFGFCCFAWTTFNCIPHPLGDIQVRADGEVRRVEKTHDLSLQQINWLLEPKPEVLIIGIGWDGVVRSDAEINTIGGSEVRIMKTPEAIQLFNSLKGKKRVAIHVHSTC